MGIGLVMRAWRSEQLAMPLLMVVVAWHLHQRLVGEGWWNVSTLRVCSESWMFTSKWKFACFCGE
jgi:hypothetical protein